MSQNHTDNNQLNDWEFEDELQPIASPLSNTEKVVIEKAQYSVYELLRHIAQHRITLSPSFQRNNVWNNQQKSELIESILLGLPLPLIYLFEDEYGYRQVIDGKQRISTLKDFIGDEFKLTNLQILANLNQKHFSALSGLQQSILEDHQLLCYVLKPPTPEQAKFAIYDRVNRGGTQLNKQEIRFALYQGQCTQILQRITNGAEFEMATGNAISSKRMKDQYAILKSWSFFLCHPQTSGDNSDFPTLTYKGDIDELLSNTMKLINNLPTEALEYIERMTNIALDTLAQCCGPDVFRFESQTQQKRPVNIALMESLLYIPLKMAFNNMSITDVQLTQIIQTFTQQLEELDLCGKSQNKIAEYSQRQRMAQSFVASLQEEQHA